MDLYQTEPRRLLASFAYDRDAAVAYAHRWAYGRNPEYFNFQGIGGDCTNFASQCLFAGAGVMNYTPVYGWYYITANARTASWTGVEFLYAFLTENQGEGPFATEVTEAAVGIGDVVQLLDTVDDAYHTLLVSGFAEGGGILVAAHSDDAFDRPLSTYTYINARFLHIEGVRFEIEFTSDTCFAALLGGEAIVG